MLSACPDPHKLQVSKDLQKQKPPRDESHALETSTDFCERKRRKTYDDGRNLKTAKQAIAEFASQEATTFLKQGKIKLADDLIWRSRIMKMIR
jgi:hypothetical protein